MRVSENERKAVWRDIGVLRRAAALPLTTDEPTYLLPDAQREWWFHVVAGTSLGFTYGFHMDDQIILVSIRRRLR